MCVCVYTKENRRNKLKYNKLVFEEKIAKLFDLANVIGIREEKQTEENESYFFCS